MLPRLRAEESLRGTTVTAVGTGSLSKETSRRTLDGWQADAGVDREVDRTRNPTPLKAAGIGVRTVAKKRDG